MLPKQTAVSVLLALAFAATSTKALADHPIGHRALALLAMLEMQEGADPNSPAAAKYAAFRNQYEALFRRLVDFSVYDSGAYQGRLRVGKDALNAEQRAFLLGATGPDIICLQSYVHLRNPEGVARRLLQVALATSGDDDLRLWRLAYVFGWYSHYTADLVTHKQMAAPTDFRSDRLFDHEKAFRHYFYEKLCDRIMVAIVASPASNAFVGKDFEDAVNASYDDKRENEFLEAALANRYTWWGTASSASAGAALVRDWREHTLFKLIDMVVQPVSASAFCSTGSAGDGLIAQARDLSRQVACTVPNDFYRKFDEEYDFDLARFLNDLRAKLDSGELVTARDILGHGRASGKVYESLSNRAQILRDMPVRFADHANRRLFPNRSLDTGEPIPANLSVALALDCSGSMDGQKLDVARQAAELFVNLLTQNDEAALVTFATNAAVAAGLSLAADATTVEYLRQRIRAAQAGGNTNFVDALRATADELDCCAGKPCIAFMSDGMATAPFGTPQQNYPTAEVQRCRATGIPVCTIAFGQDADEAVLRRIAEETGGQFFPAAEFTLSRVFVAVSGWQRDLSDLLAVAGLIHPREETWHDVIVSDDWPALIAVLTWSGSDVGLLLRRPAGQLVPLDPATAPPGVRVVYDPQSHSRIAVVEKAEAGVWSIGVRGNDVPEQGEVYALSVQMSDSIPVRAVPLRPEYVREKKVDLGVSIGSRAPGTAVKARVRPPDGSWQDLPLTSHQEVRGGMLVYTGSFGDTAATGFYEAEFEVVAGQRAARLIRTTFQVGSVPEIIAAEHERAMRWWPCRGTTAVPLAILACVVLQVLVGGLMAVLCWSRRSAKLQVAPFGVPLGGLSRPGRPAGPRPPVGGLDPWDPDGQPDPYRR